MSTPPFWKTTPLEEMDQQQWESLCDGCGLCCLNKLEDWDSGDVVFTCIGCRLLDGDTARCKSYENRQSIVEDCIQLTPQEVRTITWLPPTCGYRLVRDGEDLKWWHPLVSGDPETVHEAGISVRGRTVNEEAVEIEDYEDYVVDWPLTVGDGAAARGRK